MLVFGHFLDFGVYERFSGAAKIINFSRGRFLFGPGRARREQPNAGVHVGVHAFVRSVSHVKVLVASLFWSFFESLRPALISHPRSRSKACRCSRRSTRRFRPSKSSIPRSKRTCPCNAAVPKGPAFGFLNYEDDEVSLELTNTNKIFGRGCGPPSIRQKKIRGGCRPVVKGLVQG